MIYAYMSYVSDRFGYIKVGYTEENPQRVIFDESEWTGLTPGIVLIDSAIRKDGSILTGETFREYLRQQGYKELSTGYDHKGWFDCSPEDIITAYKHAISQHIVFLKSNMTDISKTMREINSTLKTSGFTGFHFREKEGNAYELVRDSQTDHGAAIGLSEGERRFVAFLYFFYIFC